MAGVPSLSSCSYKLRPVIPASRRFPDGHVTVLITVEISGVMAHLHLALEAPAMRGKYSFFFAAHVRSTGTPL